VSYCYKTERPWIFSEDGSRQFLRIRDRVNRLLDTAGAVRMQEAINDECGSSWEMLACVDRMVELGEIRELTDEHAPGQWRVFTRRGR